MTPKGLTAVPFKVMFGEKTDIPIVQVSLYGEDDIKLATELGKALSAVRDQGYTLVCIGQPLTRPDTQSISDSESMDYMRAVRDAVTADDPLKATLALQDNPVFPKIPFKRDYQPLVVATAAVLPGDKSEIIAGGSDSVSRDYLGYDTGYEGPMGWVLCEWK